MKPAVLLLPLLLGACHRPEPPDTERPPEPKAASAAARLHAPLRRAHAVQAELDAAARAEREKIEAAGG